MRLLAQLRQTAARLSAFFRKEDLDRELNEELDGHVAMLADDYVRRGMTQDQAERAARLELGGRAQIRESHSDTRGIPFLDTLLQDLRYTFRTLRHDSGFTTFAILIIGLGIGASSTVFSVVNTLLIRPLPFRDPGRLVWISNNGNEGDLSGQTVPVDPFLDLREQAKSFSDVAAYYAFYGVGDRKMTGDGEPERLSGVPGLARIFSTFGNPAATGQIIHGGRMREERPGSYC